MFLPAAHWEYQWKFAILIASQPVLALAAYLLLDLPGPWYSPDVAASSAIAGVGLITLGLALRSRGTLALSPEVMATLHPDTETLVTHDLYGSTRNPLYLGTILAITGFGAFFGPEVALLFLVFHAVRYDRVVRYEESLLHRQWGSAFSEYLNSVPRWIPRRLKLSREVPWLTGSVVIANGVFVGLLVGALVALTTGQMWTMYAIQLGCGIIMGIHLYGQGREHGSEAPVTLPVASETRKAA